MVRFCWLRANLYDPWSRGSQFDARLNLGNRNGQMTLRKSEEEKVVRGKRDRSIGKTSMSLWKE
ncbi:unnamed protein product [Prunus armeniaca]|uniref:Uncharacterized protein n=1 Tax=Prunus armeniaca TaxID=36596 RepID=A0A6J5VLL0_PRUAR|nr:unnamed protein product [Prunus armeniaca]CAB4319316.1 unnamed protein product [Prunus armeniaca]